MNKIHRKLEYALIAIKYLSSKPPGELTTVKEICQRFNCPFDATSRVMQQLAHKGLLKSEQGAFGGYQIVRDLARVNIYELIEIILGPIAIAKCLQETDCEILESCNIYHPVAALNKRLLDFYSGITLKELFSSFGGKAPVGQQPIVNPALSAAAQSAAQAFMRQGD